MGQKVHPIGIRLGIVKDWSSTWYAERGEYADNLNTDIAVRNFVRRKLGHASVSRIHIERPAKNARIVIHTARPGIVIGKKGEDIEALRSEVSRMMDIPVHISVEEIRKPELDAYLVAESVANQLERRIMFRRAMRRAVTNAMRLGAEVQGRTCAVAHLARGHRLWLCGGKNHVRCNRCQDVDIQGRNFRSSRDREGLAFRCRGGVRS